MVQHSSFYQKIVAPALLVALVVALVGFSSSPSQAQTADFTVGQRVTSTNGANVRSGPDRSYAVVGVLNPGQIATVTGAPTNGWFPLSVGSLSGYVAREQLRAVSQPAQPTSAPAASVPAAVETAAPALTSNAAQPSSTPVSLDQPPATVVASQPTAVPTPINPTSYANVQLGALNKPGSIRSGPNLNSTIIKTWGTGRRVIVYSTVKGTPVGGNDNWYIVGVVPERDRTYYVHSSLVNIIGPVMLPPASQRLAGRWIDVNITQQTLTAFEGQAPVMHTLISSGTKKNPTELGRWFIYYRVLSQTMASRDLAAGDPEFYNLPGVKNVQYFHMSGEAVHAAYWHDNFGTRRSHGCINATFEASAWLWTWARNRTPVMVHEGASFNPINATVTPIPPSTPKPPLRATPRPPAPKATSTRVVPRATPTPVALP